ANGCETNVQGDLANCGACGRACGAVANGTGTCSAGACRVASCASGFADCDGLVPNGCELNTTSDENNCGACGRVCATGQECTAGACVSVLRSEVRVCGSVSRDVRTFFPAGTSFTLVSSCTPSVTTQAMFITRSGSGYNGPALAAYITAGGIVLTEYSISHTVFNAVFGTAAPQGASNGSCTDNIPMNFQFSPGDQFWADNPFVVHNSPGCGHNVGNFPGVTPIVGWNASNVAVAYRRLSLGRFWAVDVDWQDNESSWLPNSSRLMGYMMTTR
ncbi:MAG: hypothetical protein Q8S73_12520, partial [Deltaproteobacteria bacterium]|nr:hypothetical protein [Deltaproteobacteria bacterium]